MMTIWAIVCSFFCICTALASFRVGLIGFRRFETAKVLRFLTAPAWCLFVFIFVFWQIGEFARGENSSLPWEAFTEARLQHGLFEGLLSATIVLIVDLWLFWIPASLWIHKHSDADGTKRIMARVINLLLGVVLSQVANPIYRLMNYMGL